MVLQLDRSGRLRRAATPFLAALSAERNSFYRAQGSVDHFDVWEYGTNLIHLELDQYSKKDPILGEPGAVGSREFFGFTRSTIGFNEITHSKVFSNFLFNDVGFEGGFTAGVQNNYLAEQTTQYLVGLNFDIAIPKQFGTLLVGVLARKEFTHNQFNACGPPGFGDAQGPAAGFGGGTCIGGASFSGDRDFKWDWNVEIFDAIPLGGIFGSWADPLRIIDITNIRGPKGTGISTANCLAIGCFGAVGGFNNNETKTEVFEDVRLSLDASKVFWTKPGIWDTYVGYRYWYNKFGTNHNAALFSPLPLPERRSKARPMWGRPITSSNRGSNRHQSNGMPGLVAGHVCFCGVDRRYPSVEGIHRRRA